MREHKYEPLTASQNKLVNDKLNVYQEAVKENVLTKQEADFSFQEWATENFSRQIAFLICTNRDEFLI